MGDERSFWAWGKSSQMVDPRSLVPLASQMFATDFSARQVTPPPDPARLHLPTSSLAPEDLPGVAASADALDRARHARGRSFLDIARGLRGDFGNAPDLVAYPQSVDEVAAVLDFCVRRNVACIPFGGGTSVVGGVEPRVPESFGAALSLDMSRMAALLELDQESRTAHFQAGILGPALESALQPSGMTLRHYPQSFEFSTLGGWIATRAGGHFATGPTHIDDFVASITAVTAQGTMTSRRLPSSAAGPSPDRLLLGSEGILGVITSAWVRVRERPRYKAEASAVFESFDAATAALRHLVQSGLQPSNARALDELESRVGGVGDGTTATLLIGFESAATDVTEPMRQALRIVSDAAPVSVTPATQRKRDGARDSASEEWRNAFVAAPYVRDGLVRLSVIAETFETAVPWDRFRALHAGVIAAANAAFADLGVNGAIACRTTHAYSHGVAPYYTVFVDAGGRDMVELWQQIKAAVSDALIDAGGTITHHHAVGRDHRPWYDRQRPQAFADMLRGAKAAVDPAGVLNPGVLIDP